MRFRVDAHGVREGKSRYGFTLEKSGSSPPVEAKLFASLAERAAKMARREFKDEFLELELNLQEPCFVLRFKAGISTRRNRKLQRFLGWVELFGSEDDEEVAEPQQHLQSA